MPATYRRRRPTRAADSAYETPAGGVTSGAYGLHCQLRRSHVSCVLHRIPALGSHDSYMAAIDSLPLVQTPEVFGLHANADISYYTSATKALWRNLVRFCAIVRCLEREFDHWHACQCCSRMSMLLDASFSLRLCLVVTCAFVIGMIRNLPTCIACQAISAHAPAGSFILL